MQRLEKHLATFKVTRATLTFQFVDQGDLRAHALALVSAVLAGAKGHALGTVAVLAALAGAVLQRLFIYLFIYLLKVYKPSQPHTQGHLRAFY